LKTMSQVLIACSFLMIDDSLLVEMKAERCGC
jgi:hypothetical protein